ncbi:MAG: flavodoxin [Lachnospiraceae bacterium]|nr:flavodoxin [Lachnospiraceae bacterium]
MKKIISILLIGLMALGLAACRNNAGTNIAGTRENNNTENVEETSMTSDNTETVVKDSETASKQESATANTESGNHILVVFFSATGTTKGIAETIAAVTGADIYEIKAAQEYTSADLDYGDSNSRTSKEQNDSSVRPEIGSETISLDGYDTIYIGYPIWWGEEPRIMDTFVENYDFDGITMIPFCTSGGSGVGRSDKNLADHAGSGNWLKGERLSGSASESDIENWINSLK